MTSRSAPEDTPAPPAKERGLRRSGEDGPPESFADALNAMELAYSSVLCSVDGCNVSPVRGRICQRHLPRFNTKEWEVPPLDRALAVLEMYPRISRQGLEHLARAEGEPIRLAKEIQNRNRRAKRAKRTRKSG